METKTIEPQALYALMSSDASVQLIDVRTPAEFEEIHAASARNVPLDRLNPEQFRSAKSEKLFLICKSGARGSQACEKLAFTGIEGATNVTGGTDEWAKRTSRSFAGAKQFHWNGKSELPRARLRSRARCSRSSFIPTMPLFRRLLAPGLFSQA